MPRYLPARFFPAGIAAGLCALIFAGCASWQGPRIDPTGEQFFVWPNEPAPAVSPTPFAAPAPVPAGPVVAPPPSVPIAPFPASPVAPQPAPIVAPLPFGNVQAPPVYSDPPAPTITPPPPGVIPPVPVVPGVVPSLPAATVVPAVPIVMPGAIAPLATTVAYGRDSLRVTPDRLVAPVGSEILLKAGICGADGYLVANQRVEWSVARTGVGQFTQMGIRDPTQLLGWWEAPQKIDDWCAIGTTAYVPVSLNAGTPDPNDDVHIFRGESWVTLTSATEGTSVVTAYAPHLSEYNQGTATIFWIDAQWIFPASVAVPTGRPHVLTTTIMRRTDGAPLAGWIVRYNVASGASLGYEGGNNVEVPTDASGRASVEVSPMDPGGGATNVGITIIRPASVGPNALPRMELGRSAATIAWSAAAAPVPPSPGPPVTPAPTPFGPPPTLPPSLPQPPPTLPSNTSPPSTYSPPPSQPAGRPRLDVSMRPVSPEQVAVGEYVGYELSITNRGDGVARHIQVRDTFDKGLRHPSAPNENSVVNSNIRELAPNDSETVRLTLQLIEPGEHCHDVTVTADGADPATQHACATGVQAALEVKITGPRSRVVGETAEFSVVVRNTGATAAGNVELVIKCDPAIVPFVEASERLPDGGVLIRVDRGIAPNERRVFRVHGRCQAASNHACARASATALGGANSVDEACLEILPARSGEAPSGFGTP